ncbi:WD40-repeat-containing domain protein [Cercophora newfieldiana]|uniref:WD40-repeat-containing domain protein n=1 Tax=Cercophora newfieldiana TaxID=92897 RepID=A0AA39YSS0_9PEZI|nr:WD40-repeat-containing domain protein [Cercophora newfieldiana]
MSELESAGGHPLAEQPPPKRRRVHNDGNAESVPRHGSLDAPLRGQSLSIRRAPKGLKETATPGSDDTRNRYRSSTPSSPRRSRSRSQIPTTRPRQPPRSPMYSASQSPRSPRSRRSPTRSRSSSESRSSTSGSRSRSRTHSRSSSSSSSARRSPRSPDPESQLPPPPPSARQPLTPHYQKRVALRGHTAAISQVRISPDGRWIASASADGTAKIWDAQTGENIDTLVGHMAGLSCVAWAPDSNCLATGSDDKAIRLWDRVTADPAHACGDGGRAYGAGEDGKRGRAAKVDYRRKKAETRGGMTGSRPLLGHHNYVYCLAFSPKGNILASGSYDEAVFLWDVRAGRLMRSLPAHSDPVSGIDFCRDGTLVVSCSTDGLIRIWDTSTGQCLRTLVHEDNPAVTNVCFSPNGRFVLAFSLDSSIRLWDYVSGAVKKTYQGHKNEGFSIGGCFGLLTEADGRSLAFVASASEDGDIVLWDVITKQIVQRLEKAHKGICFWVDVHGGALVSAGQDGTIEIFSHAGALPEGGEPMNGVVREVNGVNGHDAVREGSITPNAAAMADDELQRQIEEDAGSPMLLQVKEEQL